ncbi:hypothetical protein [Bifidobacterium thermacidophilum]|nr:hypothetical protein [Bifidobacterium thermacidophilum]
MCCIIYATKQKECPMCALAEHTAPEPLRTLGFEKARRIQVQRVQVTAHTPPKRRDSNDSTLRNVAIAPFLNAPEQAVPDTFQAVVAIE